MPFCGLQAVHKGLNTTLKDLYCKWFIRLLYVIWRRRRMCSGQPGNIQNTCFAHRQIVLVNPFWGAHVNRASIDNINLFKKASIPRLQDSWVNQNHANLFCDQLLTLICIEFHYKFKYIKWLLVIWNSNVSFNMLLLAYYYNDFRGSGRK